MADKANTSEAQAGEERARIQEALEEALIATGVEGLGLVETEESNQSGLLEIHCIHVLYCIKFQSTSHGS